MRINWRAVAHLGALVASQVVPQAAAIEAAVEGAVDARTNPEKAALSVEALVQSLNAAAALSGQSYNTPRVVAAIRRLNDDGVELVNALADAHTQA